MGVSLVVVGSSLLLLVVTLILRVYCVREWTIELSLHDAKGLGEIQDKGQTLKNGPSNIHVWIKHKLLRGMQDFSGHAGYFSGPAGETQDMHTPIINLQVYFRDYLFKGLSLL
jgi:hypothetical protein